MSWVRTLLSLALIAGAVACSGSSPQNRAALALRPRRSVWSSV